MTRTGFVELPRYPVVSTSECLLLEGVQHNFVMINVLVEIVRSIQWWMFLIRERRWE